MNTKQELLRWLLMPFAAFVGASVAAIAAGFLLWFGLKFQSGWHEGENWMSRNLVPIIASFVFGYIYSAVAFAVAPRNKIFAGKIMIALLGILSVSSILLELNDLGMYRGELIKAVFGCVILMIAAFISLSHCGKESS